MEGAFKLDLLIDEYSYRSSPSAEKEEIVTYSMIMPAIDAVWASMTVYWDVKTFKSFNHFERGNAADGLVWLSKVEYQLG